jgi:hypothetical protein
MTFFSITILNGIQNTQASDLSVFLMVCFIISIPVLIIIILVSIVIIYKSILKKNKISNH